MEFIVRYESYDALNDGSVEHKNLSFNPLIRVWSDCDQSRIRKWLIIERF